MKRYRGIPIRTSRGGYIVEVLDSNRVVRSLAPRNDLWNHSPDGFAWGYGGSGPAQLALALAADVLGDDKEAVRVHQALKRVLVLPLRQDYAWMFSEDHVREALREIGGTDV